MRLSDRIISKIKKSIIDSFGSCNVYLFGSRVDDTKRGGDIDLAIDTRLNKDQFREKKSKFIANLIKLDFDYKIDLVNLNTSDKLLLNEINNNKVKII
jgi:predicted nucleotidyltransferase